MKKLTIEIPGNAIAKKNSQYAVSMGKRNIICPSQAYKKWAREATKYLKHSGLKYTGKYPAKMTFYHYRKTLAKFDLSNMFEGVQDLFQDLEIIEEDDMNHIIPAVNGRGWEKDAENPRVLVTIEPYIDPK